MKKKIFIVAFAFIFSLSPFAFDDPYMDWLTRTEVRLTGICERKNNKWTNWQNFSGICRSRMDWGVTYFELFNSNYETILTVTAYDPIYKDRPETGIPGGLEWKSHAIINDSIRGYVRGGQDEGQHYGVMYIDYPNGYIIAFRYVY